MTDDQMKRVIFWVAAVTAVLMLIGGCLSVFLQDYVASTLALLIIFGLVWIMFSSWKDEL